MSGMSHSRKIGLQFRCEKTAQDSTANIVPGHFARCCEDEDVNCPITKVSSDKGEDQVLTLMQFMFPAGYPFSSSSDVLPSTPSSGWMLQRSHDEMRSMVKQVWRWLMEFFPML